MIRAKVLKMQVIPASNEYRQGIKGSSTATYYKGGAVHRRNGFGGERIISPTRLILIAEVASNSVNVFVDSLFREELGKLTQKRIRTICNAVPAYVWLEPNENFRGDVYYVLAQESFTAWLARMR